MPITTTSFTSVNVGTSANDGTGDELRNAFIKVNSNFSNISTVGFNSGNILASGNVEAVYFVGDGSQLTNISASNAYGNANVAAYLVAYNGIVSASNVFVSGNVTSQWFVGQANLSSIITTDLGASGMIYANAGVNSTSTGTGALVVNGGVGITGNLTVGNLTVLGTQTVVSATSVAVANSFIFLSNNNITNVLDIGFVGQYAEGQGNVYTGLVRRASDGVFRLFSNLNPIPSTTINVANITLATLQLGNILAGNVTGVINVAAQPYITSLGNLASLSSSGNITTTGYFFGNGSQLAGIVSYSNVFVATYLPTYSGNIANLTVATTLAGPTITAINSNVTVGNTNMKNYVDGQITAANSAVTAANLGLKGYVDNSVSTANIGMKGYVDSVASQSIYGNSNVKSYLTQFDGNLISNGNIAYNIGTAVNQWASVYANVIYANSNIYIGGTDIKSYIDSVASLSIYSNVNTKAYTESMGYQNYGNVNVAAYVTSMGVTNYSNVNVIAYLAGNVTVGNISATYFTGNGSQLTGLPSGYSNVQVATYLPTYSGNIANIRLGVSGVLTFPDGTTQITAGGGGSNYSNANVTAYTVSMGFTNFSNVNVKAYSESMGYQNYGNVNVAALITTNGLTNYSNANVQSFVTTNGLTNYSNANVQSFVTTNGLTNYSNVNVAAYLGTGQITAANVKLAPSGNIQFADGTSQTSAYSNVNLIANLRGSITVGNITILGALNTTLNIGNSFIGLATDNTSNTNDIGFYGQYNVGQGNVFTGLAYTATDGMYRLFSNLTPEPGTTINQANVRYSNIQVGGLNATGNILANVATFGSGNVAGFAIGYRDVPQITAANVTLIASDAGKHYYGSNTNPVTLTIPLNSSVAFGNGTAISLVNQGTGNITITPTAGVLLYLAGNTVTGSKTLTTYGMATLLKVQVNTWFINGTGVS